MKTIAFQVTEYFLNSLWIVPLVFAFAWVAARMVRRAGPQAEHRVWVGALLMEVLLPALHLRLAEVWRSVSAVVLRGWGAKGGDGDTSITFAMGAGRVQEGLHLPQWLAASLAIGYAGVIFYFAMRLGWGLWRTRATQRVAEPMETEGAIAHRWALRCREAGVEDAALMSSARMHGPATVGVRRAVLMVPPGFFDGMAESEMDAVMAHECAHMSRYDFAKNVFYSIVALPVAYHSLLWMTSSRLTESREMVCDAMAAEAVAGREKYARSLLWLASLLADHKPAGTIHAIGIFDANSLERRIMNLTRRSEGAGWALRMAMLGACVAIGAATCASAMALRMNVGAEKKDSNGPIKIASGVIAGNIIYQKHPVYPAEAKANKDTIDGSVVLEAIISKEGVVQNLRVKQSLRSDYDLSALEAVKDWRYKPYILNGDPTEVETTITVNFSIGK